MNDEPPSRRSRPRIEIVGRPPEGVGAHSVRGLLAALLRRLEHVNGAVSVRFACDRTVRRYNREYRGIDRATDVLSFPLRETVEAARHLGDLLISRDRVRVQARRAGLSPRRETEELLIHGTLHLLGYDHEVDDGVMNRLELQLRHELLDQRPGRS